MSTADEFTERVREATLGTPYLVTPRDDGFSLAVNLVDAQWYTIAYKRGLRSRFRFDVRLEPDTKVYRITDDVRSLTWGAGVPGGPRTPLVGGAFTMFRGRIVGFRKVVAFGIDARTGRLEKVVDFSFKPSEGHRIIRAVGEQMGWQEKLPGIVKGAIGIGVVGLSAIPVVIVLALMGKLS